MSLPTSLMNSLHDAAGFNRDAFINIHESNEQVTSIRVNPRKNFEISEFRNFEIERVPWSSFGYYLHERPIFTLDPLFHAGCYYVQEASSMFLEQALKQTADLNKPIKVIDLCAAPGGKSTLIQSLLHEESLLVSNEVIKSRVNILQENMTKWSGANVIVTNSDAKHFAGLENYFDVMVVDAPCSGSGLFRKDPGAISEWSLENVALCSQRQQRILADAFPSLKRNGVLIYSTCSYSMEEDEAILDWLSDCFEVKSLRLSMDPSWGIAESLSPKSKSYGYRFYPDRLKGEGLFIAALQKTEGHEESNRHRKTTMEHPTKNELSIVKNWITSDTNATLIKHEDEVLAVPRSWLEEIPVLRKCLYLKQVGITIGKLTSKELIPDHALAMSNLIAPGIVSVSLNKETALQYLRKADVFIDVGQRGWVLVKYCGINLGWIKHLGNRINNYYPKDWRILMQ